jgi:hypothetical protein
MKRRILLSQTRHHLYYSVVDDRIEVLALWSATRRRGPSL